MRVDPTWRGETCVVAAPGPSLTLDVVRQCEGLRAIAVGDAYRLFRGAEILYAADYEWWVAHDGCPEFEGEKWTAKQRSDGRFRLNYISVRHETVLSRESHVLHGFNSGSQAINMAVLKGASKIILVGFNMQRVDGRAHFEHGEPHARGASYDGWVPSLTTAASSVPKNTRVINATPRSALIGFESMRLEEALRS